MNPPGTASELRITDLRLDYGTAIGVEVCLVLKAPCQAAASFCADVDGVCRFAIVDPLTHECCPTCAFPRL